MMIDLDRFKAINDGYGHEAGDQVLKCFAARVKKLIRDADIFCRLSGDEFIVVMPDTQIAVAARIAERVRAGIEMDGFAIAAEKRPISVTVSVGVAESAGDAHPELLRRADKALYRSKQTGRNRICLDGGRGRTQASVGLRATGVL